MELGNGLMTDISKLFCSKPFSWFEVTRGATATEGEVYVCCPSWLPKTIGNLLPSSVAEVWNSEAAVDIRKSILDGSFKYCKEEHCPYLQTQTGPVQQVE